MVGIVICKCFIDHEKNGAILHDSSGTLMHPSWICNKMA